MRQNRLAQSFGVLLLTFLFGWGLVVAQEGPSCQRAPASWAWTWSGTPFTQSIRCENVLSNGAAAGTVVRKFMPGPFRAPRVERLKFLELNMLNLFERDFKLTGLHEGREGRVEKTEAQREGLARIIRQSDPDIMTWVEVENQAAAEMFSRRYLDDRYQVFLIEGNDSRGIDVTVLVKKDLPLDVEYRSLRDLTYKDGTENDPVFSRDLPVAVFRRKEGDGVLKEQFILLSTHYKSQRGDDGGLKRRRSQVEATGAAFQMLRQEFGPELPIFLTGDFNNTVHQAPEFSRLWEVASRTASTFPRARSPRALGGLIFIFPIPAASSSISWTRF